MRRLVRSTVFWLLAAALPLQGVSAATLLSCAPVGHHGNAVHASPHDHDAMLAVAAPAATDAVAASHGHDGHASHAAVDHGDVGDARSGAGGAPAKCSACSFCCSGAAAPARLLVFGPLDLPEFYAPFAARSVAAVVSEGLERPPRTFLA